MLTCSLSAREACQLYQPASVHGAIVPAGPSAPSGGLGATPRAGRQIRQEAAYQSCQLYQPASVHGATVPAGPSAPSRDLGATPGAGRQIRQARQGGDDDVHDQVDQGQEDPRARSWRACDVMHKCSCRSCTYVVDGGHFPFRQASASELGARQSHKSHEQTDDGNEHRDPSPEPHDLRLQIHCLHVQHVAAHHVSVFTPEPAPGRRAGHAQARGDARVARGWHELSQPVVVDALSFFHATHHRRARVGGNFPVVMVAASSLTRTRASKSRLSWLTAARFVFGTGRGSGTEHRRSAIVGRFAGWPRAVACPGLPQIRTCAIDASGSLVQGLATR